MQRSQQIEQRKREKRERKARGLRNASSSGSSSSSETLSLSDPPTPPNEAAPLAVADEAERLSTSHTPPIPASTTLAYRKVVMRRSHSNMVDSRIRGADLYVVRLLQDTHSKAKMKEQRRRQRGQTSVSDTASNVRPQYADSRPCWRCLEWMYWAGIKRVFWTDTDGVWHGDKVVQLLFGSANPNGLASMTSSAVYVPVHLTQYEHAAAKLRIKTSSQRSCMDDNDTFLM